VTYPEAIQVHVNIRRGNHVAPTPEQVTEALKLPCWSLVKGTGFDAVDSLIDHVPSDVRRMAFYAPMHLDPIAPIWKSLRHLEMDAFDVIGLCYGLTHERVRQIHDGAIRKLRRNPELAKLAESAQQLRQMTDSRLETDWSDG
jgi:hypothetical protein